MSPEVPEQPGSLAEARPIPAVITAGDGRAARAIEGESKVYVEIGERPLVAQAVAVLQRVPEVSEVWVVGNAPRLSETLARHRDELVKPLTIVPQFRNLYENCWETYRRALPGAGPDGRDPSDEEARSPFLYMSADLPFATPQEVSAFVRSAREANCDYALGLVTAESLEDFASDGARSGIDLASFNMREGRFRQSNLHLVKPARIGHRQLVEDMYEHRYQKEIGNAIALAWTMLRSEGGGFAVIYYYLLMHLGGWMDRRGFRRLADRIRRGVGLARVERGISAMLDGQFRFIVTEAGGCAIDIDNVRERDAARARFAEWTEKQRIRAESLYGPPPIPERAGTAPFRVVERREP